MEKGVHFSSFPFDSNFSYRYYNTTEDMFFNESENYEEMIAYDPYELPKGFILGIVCLYGMVVLVSIGGNVVVCYTIVTVQRLRTVTNFFLASLSVSDILMTVTCVPFTVLSNIIFHYWPFGEFMCPLVQYCQLVAVLQRAWTMVAVACDRHFVISRPLKKRMTKLKARVLIVAFWIIAMMTAIPTAIFSKVIYLPYEPGSRGLCVEHWTHHRSRYIYSVAIMLLQYFIPLIIMMITYIHIGIMIWMKKLPGEADVKRDKRVNSSKRKTLKMLVAVVITYAVAWLPLHILTILGDLNPKIYNHMFAHIMWLLFHFVAVSNSGINPIIYCYMNQSFRIGFTLLFRKLICVKKYSRNLHQSTRMVSSVKSAKGGMQYENIMKRKSRKFNGSFQCSTDVTAL